METFKITYPQRRALLAALKPEARFVGSEPHDILILDDYGNVMLKFNVEKVNEIAGPAKDPDLQTPSEREVVNNR